MDLSSLENQIKVQLAREFHDIERQKYEWENMTVPRLLEMLSYMDLSDLNSKYNLSSEDYTAIYGWGGQG